MTGVTLTNPVQTLTSLVLGLRTLVGTGSHSTAFKGIISGDFFLGIFSGGILSGYFAQDLIFVILSISCHNICLDRVWEITPRGKLSPVGGNFP